MNPRYKAKEQEVRRMLAVPLKPKDIMAILQVSHTFVYNCKRRAKK